MNEAASSLPSDIAREIARRRTFAIISHPDAGKTTLTEKLLLYSGMIRTAGMVKNRKGGKLATSDWMAMEQERGISITSSAMQFPYKGAVINVLDTPGHQDFSEDTYRTLTAADSAIMVIDAAKGVEVQTRKLFAVCKLRGIPVLTFINKLDLPGRDPLELMAEVEEVLGIQSCAMNWPIGSGREFVGVVDRGLATGAKPEVLLFKKTAAGGAARAAVERLPLSDAADLISGRQASLKAELEMIEGAGNAWNRQEFLAGRLTPVFFGSALTNFGVESFFDAFVALAPPPGLRTATGLDGQALLIDPVREAFSSYVFKIQANMNPRHRDSVAFVRICSGRFERDLVVRHLHRGELVRELRLSRPHTLMAQERTTLDEAWPGDVVGLINSGFAIGDTLVHASIKPGFEHQPLPQFPPEVFAQVQPVDLTKRKQFDKGMLQLAQEGAVQVLRSWDNPQADPFIAAVGRLQFEVLQYRLRDEYSVETHLKPLPFQCSGWLVGDPGAFKPSPGAMLARDARGRPVVLLPSEWDKRYCLGLNPAHQLLDFA